MPVTTISTTLHQNNENHIAQKGFYMRPETEDLLRNLRPDRLQEIAVIHHYGRSGCLFLQSLFDFHPQLLGFPGSYLLTFNKFWEACQALSTTQEIINKFVTDYKILFNAESSYDIYDLGPVQGRTCNFHRMGPNQQDRLEVDKNELVECLTMLLKDSSRPSRKEFFQAVYIAYAACRQQKLALDKKLIIVFQGHGPYEGFGKIMAEEFPRKTFLHMVRLPEQSLGSLIKYYKLVTGSRWDLMLKGLENSFHAVQPVAEEYRACSYAVRLEELHLKPQATLSQVCRLLGIEWNDSLMSSTFGGLKWWNSEMMASKPGFSTEAISRNHSEIFSAFDLFRLQAILTSTYRAWRYPQARDLLDYPYELLQPLFNYPFKFETFYFQNSPIRQKVRTLIRDKMQELWKLSCQLRGTQREVQLLEVP